MSILDIVILALLVLAGLLGFIRGGKRRLAKLMGVVAGLAVAFLTYQTLGNLFARLWGGNLAASYETKLIERGLETLSQPFSSISGDSASIKTVYRSVGIPGFFVSLFSTKIFITDGTIALAIGSSYSAAIIYACVFVLMFLLVAIPVSLLVRKLLSLGQEKEGGKTFLDRLCGLVMSEALIIFIIFVLMLILVGISFLFDSLRSWVETQVSLGSESVSISRFFYNLVMQLFGAFR